MSDINEEQKRLYKRAEEFDKKYNKYLQKELAEANNRIYKAIEYIDKNAFDVVNSEHKAIINVEELLNILKGND